MLSIILSDRWLRSLILPPGMHVTRALQCCVAGFGRALSPPCTRQQLCCLLSTVRSTSSRTAHMLSRLQLQWPAVNDGYNYMDEYISHRQQSGERKPVTVLEFYCSKHADSGTQQQWEGRIASGQVSVNGVTATAEQTLRHGDKLSYKRLPWKEPDSPNYVDILYEDAHLVALSKPSGLQVLPAAQHHQRTVLTLLQQCCSTDTTGITTECTAACEAATQPGTQQACNQEGAVFIAPHAGGSLPLQLQEHPAATGGQQAAVDTALMPVVPQLPSGSASSSCSTAVVPVHRLGKGTSGLLLCARSQQAKQRLADVMTHTTLADISSSAAVGAQPSQDTPSASGCDSSGQRYTWPGPHTQTSVMIEAAGQVPAGAVRKVYRTHVQGVVQTDSGEVCVPIGRVHYPGVRGGLWAAGPSYDSNAHTAPTAGTATTRNESSSTHLSTASSRRTGQQHVVTAVTDSQATVDGGKADQGHGSAIQVLQRGKPARSKWSVVHRGMATNTTLLNVEIFTGRPHQIRIHMAAMGHPLVGDPLYGPGGLPMGVQPAQEQLEPEAGFHSQSKEGKLCNQQAAYDSNAPCSSEVEVPWAGKTTRGAGVRNASWDTDSKLVVPGDGGYHLHSWQLLLHHPVLPGKVLHLAAPLPEELRAPWETCTDDLFGDI